MDDQDDVEDVEELADDDEDLEELGLQLFDASEDGVAAEVARLLDLNAPVNYRAGEYQETPLIAAALEGHIEVVTLLADRGGDLEARITGGETALMLASRQGPSRSGSVPGREKSRHRGVLRRWCQCSHVCYFACPPGSGAVPRIQGLEHQHREQLRQRCSDGCCCVWLR